MGTVSSFFARLLGFLREPVPVRNPDPVSVPAGGSGIPSNDPPMVPIAWGALVDGQFRQKVRQIAYRFRWDANWLMAIMHFESAGTFSPSIRNAAGSGAVGLIQFMPATARMLGTSTEQLVDMTALQQLDYVEKYLLPYSLRVHSLEDGYMAILWPKAIGKADDYILFQDDSESRHAYFENRGLDFNHDHKITKAEATFEVGQRLLEGLNARNIA